MRIMGLDVGHKRIGVAVSDELMLTAQGRETIERKDLAADLKRIEAAAISCGAQEVIVGLPLNMDGTHSQKTKEVLEFIDALAKSVAIPVKSWDERLTSRQADKILLEADMTRRKRRGLSDKLAAQLILQGYLDSRKRSEA
jgi:putative Holliday junction resolvase